MDTQEIRDQVAQGDTSVVRFEKYEDSERYVGSVFGAKTAAPSPVGEALRDALGLGREKQPTGCYCTHCECGR